MGKKIVVGPINSGLTTNRTAFVINNDSFPKLVNAYQWRGRVKRKRGTQFLTRFRVVLDEVELTAASGASPWSFNLYTLYGIVPEANAQIAPGTVTITIQDGGGDIEFTDNGLGVLVSVTPGNSGTINYNTGAVVLTTTAGVGSDVLLAFAYFPVLPALGLKTYTPQDASRDQRIGFDTTYAYNIAPTVPYNSTNVNFYKNPPSSGTYVQKAVDTEFFWNAEDYQLFDTVNYQNAMFATPGIQIPFVAASANVGMQFKPIVSVTVLTATTATLQITAHGLVVGDFVFVNEVSTTTGINYQTGYVTTVTDANNVIVTFPNATLATNGTGGIAQYLTSTADADVDPLRWYDGNPRTTDKGWVNFSPPLSELVFNVSDLPAAIYYLVGGRKFEAFKDRLLVFGPVVQASSGNPIYLPDTVIYSANGVPYYTASFTGDVSLPTTTFNQLLVPDNQTAFPPSWFEDQAGFGGFVQVGLNQRINTTEPVDDVIIVGLQNRQVRLVYTSNDILPFQFYEIDSSLGSSSPQSTVNINDTVVSRGDRGYVATTQNQAGRFDESIPDIVYQSKLTNNGAERIHGIRDYQREWAYFSYVSDMFKDKFPSATLFYNYKDLSWALFYESYTCYGNFTKQTGMTWATIGDVYSDWQAWNVPWNSGQSTLEQPQIIGGNQQGFVMVVGIGSTGEQQSLTITGISGNTITSPDHGLNEGDYIVINSALGTNVSLINGNIFSIDRQDKDTFTLNPPIAGVTYTGNGVITRMYQPFIQTKQFATEWSDGKKTRLGFQQYLLTKTANGQVTLYIYLSMNGDSPFNQGPVAPFPSTNNALIYDTILYTCPELENLGLTPANINLQQVTGASQSYIWHRMNTSLLGDVVQVAITLNDEQMRDPEFNNQFAEIELHGIIMDVSQAGYLA